MLADLKIDVGGDVLEGWLGRSIGVWLMRLGSINVLLHRQLYTTMRLGFELWFGKRWEVIGEMLLS